MKSRSRKQVAQAVLLHWLTFYGHHVGALPVDAHEKFALTTDSPALRDIVFVQCHGDEARACAMVEEIVRAPIYGSKLESRYVQFLAWCEDGRPEVRGGYLASDSLTFAMRQVVAQNTEAA